MKHIKFIDNIKISLILDSISHLPAMYEHWTILIEHVFLTHQLPHFENAARRISDVVIRPRGVVVLVDRAHFTTLRLYFQNVEH